MIYSIDSWPPIWTTLSFTPTPKISKNISLKFEKFSFDAGTRASMPTARNVNSMFALSNMLATLSRPKDSQWILRRFRQSLTGPHQQRFAKYNPSSDSLTSIDASSGTSRNSQNRSPLSQGRILLSCGLRLALKRSNNLSHTSFHLPFLFTITPNVRLLSRQMLRIMQLLQ